MNEQSAKRLVDETTQLLEDDATEWTAIEALWRPYVDQGDMDAQFHLADFYLNWGFDEGPQKDLEMQELLKMAADQNHPDAIYRMSGRYSDGVERDTGLLKAGALGSLEAQRDLGALFATGDWTGPRDLVRAAEWYRRAAERGHPDAQYNLGFMCLLGEGVASDPREGLQWLRRSAAQGYEISYHLLADLYRNGYYGVPLDPAEADQWDEKYRQTETYKHAKKSQSANPPQAHL